MHTYIRTSTLRLHRIFYLKFTNLHIKLFPCARCAPLFDLTKNYTSITLNDAGEKAQKSTSIKKKRNNNMA